MILWIACFLYYTHPTFLDPCVCSCCFLQLLLLTLHHALPLYKNPNLTHPSRLTSAICLTQPLNYKSSVANHSTCSSPSAPVSCHHTYLCMRHNLPTRLPQLIESRDQSFFHFHTLAHHAFCNPPSLFGT